MQKEKIVQVGEDILAGYRKTNQRAVSMVHAALNTLEHISPHAASDFLIARHFVDKTVTTGGVIPTSELVQLAQFESLMRERGRL